LSFYAHWRDPIARHVSKHGVYEPALTRWMGGRLAELPSGIFVDVGANLGWHAIHATQQASVEMVVAFEPDAFNAWLLDRNLSLNNLDNVLVSHHAVGAKSGWARLHRYKMSNPGRHSVIIDHGYGSRIVPMTDLDGALESFGLADRRVLILKIDVEGYEPAVIAGAMRTLMRTDVVVVEHSPQLSREGGLATDEMLGLLAGAGFAPHALIDSGDVAEIEVDTLRDLKGQADIIWIKSEAGNAALTQTAPLQISEATDHKLPLPAGQG
jgi:FkbM family methyltransferase